MNTKLPIVFFGAGPVAAKSLALLSESFQIEAIITKPTTLPEMRAASPPGAPLYSVANRKELDALIEASHLKSSCAVIVDFGIIVSQPVIDRFPLGIVNSHFSLLPQWRGADPIAFAVLSGQEQTGVSLMLLSKKMDEGPLLAQAVYTIPEGTTTPSLTNALIELSDAMLKAILPLYMSGDVAPVDQRASSLLGDVPPTYSRRLAKDDGIIDWAKSAAELEHEIRAFIGWPKSRTQLAGKDVIITEAKITDKAGSPGTVTVSEKRLFVYCGDGALEICRLKPSGKNEMSASAFLAGYGKFIQA